MTEVKKNPRAKAHSSRRRKASHGKQALIDSVMAKGISSSKAAQAVDAVIDLWKEALWAEEPVEIPGGTIQSRIRQGNQRINLQKSRNVQTGKISFRIAKFPGWRRVVKFTPDKNLDLTPLPKPQPPETSEESTARQLASELLGKALNRATMAKLQQAIEMNPQTGEPLVVQPKPGALLRRLKDIKSRGWKFVDVNELATRLAWLYWIK